MKEKVKSLWKLCFDDSEEFVEMYFNMRYKNEINIAIESGNEVISALQMIPYPMSFCGNIVETSYISGACTHPDFRGKGVMRELLSKSFTRMFHKGTLFSTLIPAEPWLFGYYERFGFATEFRYSSKDIIVPEFIPSPDIIVTSIKDNQEKAYLYLNKKLSERTCCIQHTYEDFQVIMADLSVSDGYLFVAQSENEVIGLAFAYRRNGYTLINELLAETKDAEYSLLYHIKEVSGYKRIMQLLPPQVDQPQHPLGMARIINVKEVLQLYASLFPKDEMQIKLVDKQLSVNSGYYDLYKGRCKYSAEQQPGTYISMNINELTDRILQPLSPYMSLMLN